MNTELQLRIDRIQEICGAWGLYEPGNSSAIKQALKAASEIGELADAVLKNDIDEIKDAIGDIFVCWVNYCNMKDGGDVLDNVYWPNKKGPDVDGFVIGLRGSYPDITGLEVISNHYNLTLLECIDAAIDVISKRTGKLVNGAFQKD